MPEAAQAVANAGGLTGQPPIGGSDPAANQTVVYGPPGSEAVKAGRGFPLEFNTPSADGSIGILRVLGTQIGEDIGLHIIGDPTFTSAMDVVPHVTFSVLDAGFRFSNLNLFDSGNRVTWRDAELRTDTAAYIPGDHGQGQADVVAQDYIVHQLKKLRGPHTVSNIDATTWLYQELSTVGINPDRFLLGESVPSQTVIARDVWDPASGAISEAEVPSAWTTIVRLGKELGKWVFISGRRIIFGSARFAMMWAAAEPVRIGWEHAPGHEAFVTMPSAERTTVVDRVNTLRITGRVPHARAHLFRPGVAVDVYGIMGLSATAAKPHPMMCVSVEHVLATDVDGADVVLVDPVDPPPKPPGQTNPNGANPAGAPGVTGGGASGSVEAFVRECLRHTGKRYIFGAEASKTDPNPSAFDCCIVGDMMIHTLSRGPIPAVEVLPGDAVWTYDSGSLATRKVTAVAQQPVQPVFTVRTRGRTVRASANHPLLVLRRAPRERVGVPVQWRTDWCRVDKLTRGDLLVAIDRLPAYTEPVALPDGTPISSDVAWLLGQFIGNGSVSGDSNYVFIATFRAPLRAEIARIMREIWGATTTFHDSAGTYTSCPPLAEGLRSIGAARKAHDKRVPDGVRVLPAAQMRAFLRGYADADGHLDKRGHLNYSSASRRLVDDVRAMHIGLGDRVSNVTTTKRTKPIIIKGVTVRNARPLHSFAHYPDTTDRIARRHQTLLDTYGARRALPDRTFTIERVLAVEPGGQEPTYDLEIEGSRNYSADGIIVHNSELIEYSAARVGIPGVPDGSAQQINACTPISVEQAINTRGALLYHPGHIAVSLGNSRTIEASSSARPIGELNARGRGWTRGGLLKGATGYAAHPDTGNILPP